MKKGDAIVLDINLRPSTLQEYIGQGKVKRSLQLFVDAVSKRGVVAEHLLFYGPPGMGKTTLSHIIARELNGELKTTSGPAIAKTGDLAAILTNLKDNDVLFIDEIHRLPKACLLYTSNSKKRYQKSHKNRRHDYVHNQWKQVKMPIQKSSKWNFKEKNKNHFR